MYILNVPSVIYASITGTTNKKIENRCYDLSLCLIGFKILTVRRSGVSRWTRPGVLHTPPSDGHHQQEERGTGHKVYVVMNCR